MKKIVFTALMLVLLNTLSAQGPSASATLINNTDEVFMWIDKAKELQKKLNKSMEEKKELERLIEKITFERKKAEVNFNSTSTKLQELSDVLLIVQKDAIRIRDSLNDLLTIAIRENNIAEKKMQALEASVGIFKTVNQNQLDLLEARITEFVQAQQAIGIISHIQFYVRNMWVRLEDNPDRVFAANKQGQIKVVAYHITSSFEVRKSEVPVHFRLVKKTGAGRSVKLETVIEEKFLIPSVNNLSEAKPEVQNTTNLLQKFEGEFIIQIDNDRVEKLESGTYFYEITVDNAVEKRSYEFQLEDKGLWR